MPRTLPLAAMSLVGSLAFACSEGAAGSPGGGGQGPTADITSGADAATGTTGEEGGSAGTAAAGGTPGLDAGSTGSSSMGGATNGTITVGTGFGGTTTSAGGADTSDGVGGISGAGGTSSGVGGVGGAGGASGAAGGAGGVGGGGGTLSIAASIDQFRLESPCIDADHFGTDQPDNCDVTAEVDRQTHQQTIGGSSDVVYDVKLRVRGITEPNTYQSGTLEPPLFYVGGETSQPGYTAYSLTVAEPPQVYFFNYNSSVGHFLLELDYEAVIPMRGGTTVTFDVNGQSSVPDGHGVSNRDGLVVADVPPAPEPYNGQFIQFDVIEVTPQE